MQTCEYELAQAPVKKKILSIAWNTCHTLANLLQKTYLMYKSDTVYMEEKICPIDLFESSIGISRKLYNRS